MVKRSFDFSEKASWDKNELEMEIIHRRINNLEIKTFISNLPQSL